ncbi:transmembrane protein [Mycolicibacter terrae]|nr:transmembrane protein [Mycolicibacter terrae]
MGVLCLIAAVVSLVFGVRTLARPLTGDPEQLVLRAVAPAQIAVGVILAVGGTLVLAGPPAVALLALIVSISGALAILAAGAWQGARYAARQSAAAESGGCGSGCGCGDGAPVEDAGCGPGCGCLDSAPAEPASGCGSGCGCA